MRLPLSFHLLDSNEGVFDQKTLTDGSSPNDISCRVGIDLPTIEVRFENSNIEAESHVGTRALPTFTNFMIHIVEVSIASTFVYSRT